MDKVKAMINAGVSVGTAIKEALGLTATEFAQKHGLPRTTTAETLSGARRPTEDFLAAIITDLGGTPYEWALLLWQSAKPEPEKYSVESEIAA